MGGRTHPKIDAKGSRKRKLDAIFNSIPNSSPKGNDPKGCKKHKSTGRDRTHGVTLAHLKAVICMDFIDSVCYVDIQQWGGTKMISISPAELHASLAKWMPQWEGGGGEMSHAAAKRFRSEVESLDKQSGKMSAIFGDSDEEEMDEIRVHVETELI